MVLITTRPNGLSSTPRMRSDAGEASTPPSAAPAAASSDASASCSVTVRVKTAPPRRGVVTTMSPPMSRASCLTEASPRPAIARGHPDIGLRERPEQALDLGQRETDAAIGDLEGDGDLPALRSLLAGLPHWRCRQRDAAALGEFHRVVDQVFERRTQSHGIADHQ